MAEIHPTASIDPKARLADDVVIGPYSYVGPNVELGPQVKLASHVVVTGCTRVGARTRIFPFACIGEAPQDKSFAGESTSLLIGADNVIREHVTIHVGTPSGGACTRVGDDNLIMNGTHIAHDCKIGSHTILASFSGLAGHVSVEDYAVLGAYTGVHQFTKIGESVMAAANAKVAQDVAPFGMVMGDRAHLVGLNAVGLKRRGFDSETRAAIKHAYHILFHSKQMLDIALAQVRQELGEIPEVARLIAFVESSERGVCR